MYVHLFNWPVSPSFIRMGGSGENNGIWGSLKFGGRLKIENIHLSITALERYGMEALKIDRNIERRIEKRHACSEQLKADSMKVNLKIMAATVFLSKQKRFCQ
jgi:hypothetical protein